MERKQVFFDVKPCKIDNYKRMEFQNIALNIYNCDTCPSRCDGKSKMVYNFGNDTAFSERFENEIIDKVNAKTDFQAKKSQTAGYPDIEISKKIEDQKASRYFEIKIQARTFMIVSKLLPQSNLKASETIALNQSDLERYFKIKEQIKLPLFIIWGVLNRPCIIPVNSHRFYYQEIDVLKSIFTKYGDKRRFRRKSGEGDVVDGIHKGVVVNYHFSLNELSEGLPPLS